MALGTTNISLNTVRSTLGYTTDYSLYNIGTSTLINKWSKKKPVRGTFPTSSTGTYGLDLNNSFNYLRPRGGSPGGAIDEPVRLGDFRGYEHNMSIAYPTIQNRAAENTIRTIYPINPSDYSNIWKVRFFRAASDTCITPADLGVDGYYFGLKIENSNGTYYKTQYAINNTTYVPDGSGTGYTFTVNCTLHDPTVLQFEDLPYGSGTYTWTLFISSTAAPNWTTTTPSNLHYFPVDSSYTVYPIVNSGSFTVAPWVALSKTYMDFEAEIPGYDVATVTYASGGTFSISASGWKYEVWDGTMENRLYNSSSWVTGCHIKVTPTQNTSSSAINGTLTVTTGSGATASITLHQDAAWVAPTCSWGTNYSLTNKSYSFNGSILTVTFTPLNYSDVAKNAYITIFRDNVQKGLDSSHSIRNGYAYSNNITLSETPGTGYQYVIIISDGPYIPG